MSIKIKSIFSKSFKKYGKIITGYDVTALLAKLNETTPEPDNGTMYEPSLPQLEELPIFKELSDGAYGGMPIQIGCCNGVNTKLNCLEYHRGSELNIPADDMILLLASLQDVKDGKIDSSKVEAFRVPAGTIVQVYETTLHYAPCSDVRDGKVLGGFRVIIVLPKGTNTEKPEIKSKDKEDALLWARNKWLIAHPETGEAKQGAFVGITGPNVDIAN